VNHLPVFLDVRGRMVAVVGEGPLADSRAALVRSAGAQVVRTSDVAGAVVAFIATGNEASDRLAAEAARAAGVPANVMDRPELCDFIMPAIVERGPVTVAVSTGGASPTLAQIVRDRIEAVLPARLAAVAEYAARVRRQVALAIPDPARRRAFWRRKIARELEKAA
jgi:uroporphyrin-III C-methyltransferase/precorrin-2 dehydrogenase/sirohydrochlorin ferrochelatase